MFKKLLPALLLTGCSASLYAQSPTLTAANSNPVAGEAYVLRICDTNYLPGAGGANQTWDFTSLVHIDIDTGKSIGCTMLPSTVPTCASFAGSNLVFSGRGLVRAHTYLNTSTSKRSQIGYWQGPDTMVKMTDPMDEIRYPFTYGDNFTDPFDGTLTFSAISAHHSGTNTVVADGWGKLMLPGRTDTVLRVHSSQVYTDTAMIFGSPVVQSFNVNVYSWYKAGYHSALLTIASLTPIGSGPLPIGPQKFVAYAPAQIAGIGTNEKLSSLDVYPNPAGDQVSISVAASQNTEITVTLSDMLGRQYPVAAGIYSGKQKFSYNTSALPRGIYLVKVQAGNEISTKKIELQ